MAIQRLGEPDQQRGERGGGVVAWGLGGQPLDRHHATHRASRIGAELPTADCRCRCRCPMPMPASVRLQLTADS